MDEYLVDSADAELMVVDSEIVEQADVGNTAFEPLDIDGDGAIESVLATSDGLSVLASDLTGDGTLDEVHVDSDGDGIANLLASQQVDGSYLIDIDADRDGIYETQVVRTPDELAQSAPQLAGLLAEALRNSDGGTVVDEPVDEQIEQDDAFDQVVGDPTGDSEFWFQQAGNGYCVPAAVAQIVSEYTGVDYTDESAFVALADDHGLWTDDGTGVPGITAPDTATLLDSAGVPATLEYGSLERLDTFLAEDRGVILIIDSGEIWTGEATEDGVADHAVVVTGIDYATGTVVLSDPGHPDGNMMTVPIEVLEDAWADSDYLMVVADEPAPAETSAESVVAGAAVGSGAIDAAVHRPGGWVMLPVVLPQAQVSTS